MPLLFPEKPLWRRLPTSHFPQKGEKLGQLRLDFSHLVTEQEDEYSGDPFSAEPLGLLEDPEATVKAVLSNPSMKALVIETFGSGNAPSAPWFIALLKDAIRRGLLILNISQCPGGMVIQGKYETSRALAEIGVISGADMTVEAALTKLMHLMGEYGAEKTRELVSRPLAGEMSA